MVQAASSKTGQYVKANDINMYFEEQGQGEPLLVLHGGLGRGVKNFEQHFPAFSKYFRIIAPDLRGHGRTDNPGGQLGYRLMVRYYGKEDWPALIRVDYHGAKEVLTGTCHHILKSVGIKKGTRSARTSYCEKSKNYRAERGSVDCLKASTKLFNPNTADFCSAPK